MIGGINVCINKRKDSLIDMPERTTSMFIMAFSYCTNKNMVGVQKHGLSGEYGTRTFIAAACQQAMFSPTLTDKVYLHRYMHAAQFSL